VHAAIAREAAAVGGTKNVFVLGESQGACVALDAALTYQVDVGGVFASYGQLYSATPVLMERSALCVGAFVGAGDTQIAPQLSMSTYCRLFQSGCALSLPRCACFLCGPQPRFRVCMCASPQVLSVPSARGARVSARTGE